jgi:23S rRNA (uracil1939-C5)-methyltransferase
MRVTIEKLVYGGHGLARTESGVLFVPRTAPGDVVEVEIVERKPDYARARLIRLLDPSPDRQEPYCANYDSAGCCHWQHLRYSRQLEIKESILRETLRRTARIEWEKTIGVISGPDRHYRMRASFHVKDGQLSFVEEGGHTLVPIIECAALTPEINAFIPEANAVLQEPGMRGVREVDVVSGPPVMAAMGPRRSLGPREVKITAGGFHYFLEPQAFFQSNRFLLTPFMEQVEPAAAGSTHLLELFCGSGFFTMPLARSAREILAVERSPASVRLARQNATSNGVGNVEFVQAGVEDALKDSHDLRPDTVVLNPPRSGCGKNAAERIAGLRAERIVYVSCNPSTFAREAALFVQREYSLENLVMVDQFPNTYHIELMAAFRRG